MTLNFFHCIFFYSKSVYILELRTSFKWMNSLLILYSYIFSQDEKEIIRSIAVETGDTLVDSEDYLQPNTQAPSCSNIGIPISDSPLPQVRQTWDRDTLRFTMELRPSARLCSLKGTFFFVFFFF